MKSFKLFIISDVLSQFSAGVILTALNWFVIQTYHSNELVALLANINVFSGLLISVIMIRLLAMYDAKTLIIMSLFIRILLIVVPLVIMAIFNYGKTPLLLLALSNGLGWNMYFPASKELINYLSSESNTLKLNSAAEVSMQVGLFSAGMLSGLMYKYVGFRSILIAGVILFFISLLLVSKIKYVHVNHIDKQEHVDIKKIISKNIWVIVLGITLYIPFIGANIVNTTLPGYIKVYLQGNSIWYGFSDTMYGVGACLAGIFVIGITKYYKENTLILGAFILAAITGLLIFSTKVLILVPLLIFILGMMGPSVRTIIYSKSMKILPGDVLGSILAVWNFISLILQMIFNFLIGKTMDTYGSQWGFMYYSLVLMIGTILFLSIRKKLSNIK
jgi:MFS family permease